MAKIKNDNCFTH